jgi:hypothetical protein
MIPSKALRKRRKGQFFILGALVLVILFSANLNMVQPIVSGPESYVNRFSANIQKELPKALNLGLNQSSVDTIMANFSRFVRDEMSSRQVNHSSLWLVAEGNISSSGVNVTIGNFLWKGASVTVILDGTQRVIYVPDNSTNSSVFSPVSEKYNITISYEGRSRTYEWHRPKASLYAYVSFLKEEDSSVEEFTV